MSADYHRVQIEGTITSLSPMTIGSGKQEALADEWLKKRNGGSKTEKALYTEICLDYQNNPYIPASSLRGLLAAICPPDEKYTLFGIVEESEKEKSTQKPLKLRIYDATWAKQNKPHSAKQQIRSQNSINPVTATAKDHHLYHQAYVAADSQFDWLIEADDISQQQLQTLLGLLRCLQPNPQIQLGQGQSQQQGLFQWALKQEKINILTQDALSRWLNSEQEKWSYESISPPDIDAINPEKLSAIDSYQLQFKALSPILINDPGLVSDKKTEPNFKFSRNKDELNIAASSIKGVIRSHCRKILLTLIMQNSAQAYPTTAENEQAETLLASLFGSTGQQSRIWLTDMTAKNTRKHLQTFNAVDRFTGGVADTALYTAEAASVDQLDVTLMLDNNSTRYPALTDWQKGLLLYLLQDAMQQDLNLGWGKSKGYGMIQLIQISKHDKTFDNWSDILTTITENQAEKWITALNSVCNSESTRKEID